MTDSISLDTIERFSFGKNWSRFLSHLSEDRICEAEASLKKYLNVKGLRGKTFLDVGSGSGLFSLAAHRLGADVKSFDYDTDSVQCTNYLREHYGSPGAQWTVEQGSVLNSEFLKKFGKVDVLYSWGVLHHTGNMNLALENVAPLVKEGGLLYISIYNDQGKWSRVWKQIKKLYVKAPVLRPVLLVVCGLWLWKFQLAWGLIRYGNPFKYITEYKKDNRGMSAWHDVVDWIGGYPFEVAKPEEIFYHFKSKGFQLEQLNTCGGFLGCNQYVFRKL